MFAWLTVLGCAEDTTPAAPCVGGPAVVTDIDETLTTSDFEWIAQLADATHDPEMRPEADALMRGLVDQGYVVLYVTGRGDDPVLTDDRTATEATEDWLVDHGFPYEPGSGLLALSDGIGLTGDAAAEYKAEVLEGFRAEGYALDLAYGNAESDIDAYRAAGIPDEDQFLVGELAGTMGITGIPDEEAFAAHLDAFLPTVEAVEGCP